MIWAAYSRWPAALALAALLAAAVPLHAADPFAEQIAPAIKRFCGECHSAQHAEAELNLLKYASAQAVADDFRQWEHVLTFVERGEMPPAKAPQPTPTERAALLTNIRALLAREAKKLAGDPGPVLPRRLSNAEYDNTIRDLTGVEIRPTRAFPVDPAAGEGFANSGEALSMSPSLFAKLYAAAQHVADHALLTPDGVRFAPYPVANYADKAKYCEQAILEFYARHKVDYETYLAAAWAFRHRPPAEQALAPAAFARARGLSPQYFAALHTALTVERAEPDQHFLAWLRRRWKEVPSPDQPLAEVASAGPTGQARDALAKLARDLATVSKHLTPRETPAIVSNAGNGPVAHLERRRKTAAERATFDPTALEKAQQLAQMLAETGVPPPASDKPEKPAPQDKKEASPQPAAAPGKPAADDPAAREIATSASAFCRLFPNRFYYADDTRGLSAGFHLIEGFFRDDQPLYELVLSPAGQTELDRLWTELEFVTGITEKMLRGFVFFERSERNFLKHADFDPFKEEDPRLVEPETLHRFERVYLDRSNVKAPLEELASHPIHIFFEQIRRGLASRQARLAQAAPRFLRDVEAFARRAYRRPLTADETAELRAFFERVAASGGQDSAGQATSALGSGGKLAAAERLEQAVRASLVRILVSPYFGCQIVPAPPGDTVQPLSDLALASRLSYFLWASAPDAELLSLAEAGRLQSEPALRAQTQRMLQDPRSAGLAREFFGQWLGYRDFLQQEAIDRNVYRDFDDALKEALFEEPTRLAAHLLQNDLPLTHLLAADYTFVNARLAKHYGVPFETAAGASSSGDDWRRVDNLPQYGRSGLLGMGVFLAKNSQPQRTSPVKRGFWVVHKVLGEHIPAPPADVVALPAKETDTGGKTIRELLALHVEDQKCARCHVRFDAVGLAMEGFDATGKRRQKDLAGRPVDELVQLPGGRELRGVPEFARYLAETRRDDFLRTLNRKLLGYALGRSLQLSDEVLLHAMQQALAQQGDRAGPLFETIVLSPAFRNQRCRDFSADKYRQLVQGASR